MGVIFWEAGSGIRSHHGLSTKECGGIGGWVGRCQKTPPELAAGRQWWDRIGKACAAGRCRGGRGRGEHRCFQTSDMASVLLSGTKTSGS